MRSFKLLFVFILCLNVRPVAQDMVWVSDSVERLQVAAFRQTFSLKQLPSAARITLFADSRYQLYVNGQFVQGGPPRFYPESPAQDQIDISSFLTEGNNLIAIRVLSNGTSSFQLRRNPAALMVKGSIEDKKGTIDLSTPGKWKARRLRGYDACAPKVSFALGPMEVYDQRKDPQDWMAQDFDDTAWKSPVRIDDAPWGQLRDHVLPPLTKTEIEPKSFVGAFSLRDDIDLYSFRLSVEDRTWESFRAGKTLLGYTHIYSPRNQEVPVLLWWGEHYLNGKKVAQKDVGDMHPHQQQATFDLKAGWNELQVRRKSFWGKWDFYLGVPQKAGLVLNPDKEEDGESFFMSGKPVAPDAEVVSASMAMPFDKLDLDARVRIAWQEEDNQPAGVNPAFSMAWFEPRVQYMVPPEPLFPRDMPADGPPALVYDFRHKQLGNIIIEYEAPTGTIIDVGFTEDNLPDGRPWHMKRVGLNMAVRQIASGGAGRIETINAYGLRYLQINAFQNRGLVTIKRVAVRRQVYPFERQGSFQCSDSLLSKIWEMGWRTLEVCAEDSYTDTPFRERGLYAGDMIPEIGITLCGSPDLRLAKRSLQLFQGMYAELFDPQARRHPDEIWPTEDYPFLTVEALAWYADRTHDLDFVAELYPAYRNLMDVYFNKMDSSGLVKTDRVFIEWTQIQKENHRNTAFQSILARACYQMAGLARKLGRESEAIYYEERGNDLKEAIQSLLWDEEVGAFYDGKTDSSLIQSHYAISSVFPYLYGLATPAQIARLLPYINAESQDIGTGFRTRRITAYGGFYVLNALYLSEQSEAAENFIKKYYGPMVEKQDDTAWENFDDTGIGTLSHAWSGGSTYVLSAYALGVRLGYPEAIHPEEVVIAPQASQLQWAKGAVPHPSGLVEVSWRVEGDNFLLDYHVSDEVKVKLEKRGRFKSLNWIVNGEAWED
ncbi:MAG: alpha-L-rhamnosidase N-terminal domain-containing protein [Bacteroidota bacterium]